MASLGLAALGVAAVVGVAGLAVHYRRRGVGLLGPLFWHEATLLVRRPRHSLLRTSFPAVILLLLTWFFLLHTEHLPGLSPWERLTQPVVPATALATFAQEFFYVFIFVQFVFLSLVTARVSCAALTEDRERHRLDFLFTTPLENHEIVFAKLVARLATCTLVALAAVPVLSLLPLLGGVEPLLIVAAVLFTGLTMLGLAALGVASSVYARTTGEAIAGATTFVFLYHVLSGVTCLLLEPTWGLASLSLSPRWAGPITVKDVVLAVNSGNVVVNLGVVSDALETGGRLQDVLPPVLLRYAIFQALLVLVCCRLAVVRLRSAHRAMQDRRTDPASVAPEKQGQFVELDRPPVSDRPLVWKSLYIEDEARPRPGQRVLFRLRLPDRAERLVKGGLFLASLLLPVTLAALIAYFDRESFAVVLNGMFRLLATLLGCIAWVRMTAHATATVAGERERGTLPSLLVTPLGPAEILTEKATGAVLLVRWMVVWVGCFSVVVMALGGLHPVGFLLFVLAWLAYAVILVNLGLWYSVTSPTLRAAVWRTFLTIFVGVIGTLVVAAQFFDNGSVGQGLTLSVVAPLILGASAMRGEDLGDLFRYPDQSRLAVGVVVGLVCLVVASACLWQRTRTRFENDSGEQLKGQ